MVHRAYARKAEAEVPTPEAWLKEIEAKARKEAEPIFNLVRRVSHKIKAHERGRIVYWDEIAMTPQFDPRTPWTRALISGGVSC